MDTFIERFKLSQAEPFRIKDHDPGFSGDFKKEIAVQMLDELRDEMNKLQEKMYALNRNALLIIFQAMDAAGKDSMIKHTMSGLNPQGCQVFSFKQPSLEELNHDFIWRHSRALPERGKVGIHNRSHYENVLICKVHPEYILNERIAGIESLKDIKAAFWESRYESIRNFEKHVHKNGTLILKFFLNVSKEEQKKRFLERIDQPLKNWKFSSADIAERAKWEEYMLAYEDAINATTEAYAPWYVIPADNKWFSRIVVSRIIVDTFKEMNMKLPKLSDAEKANLEACKKRLLEGE